MRGHLSKKAHLSGGVHLGLRHGHDDGGGDDNSKGKRDNDGQGKTQQKLLWRRCRTQKEAAQICCCKLKRISAAEDAAAARKATVNKGKTENDGRSRTIWVVPFCVNLLAEKEHALDICANLGGRGENDSWQAAQGGRRH